MYQFLKAVAFIKLILFCSIGWSLEPFQQEVQNFTQKLQNENKTDRAKLFIHFIQDIEKREISKKPSLEKALEDAANDVSLAETQEMLRCIPKESLANWPDKTVCTEFKPCVLKAFKLEPNGLKQMQELLLASGCTPEKSRKKRK